jgi:translation elongation factor EF-G
VSLAEPVNVVGEVDHHLGPRSEFAKVQLTAYPSEGFQVEDDTPQREQLDRLGIGWPDSAILGVLDVVMLREFGPLYNVRIVLEQAWYREIDSSERAFRRAGRRAGRKLIDVISEKRLALS